MNLVLSSAEKLLAQMSRAEKAQVAAWTLGDLGSAWPGIETIEDICDGDACIARTRIPVWLLDGRILRGREHSTTGRRGLAVARPQCANRT